MRILVAEDERITRASLVRQLQGWGHAVTAAEDGAAAWDAYQAGEFDLVITDWEMPGLSGVELIQHIRARTSTNYVYCMMLTGRSDKADIVSGIEAGADDFLSKPFDREELRVRLLAGERIVRLEQALSAQNVELRAAGERMRKDLQAAARVQRAMLPKENITKNGVRTAWTYVPTDELAGDAIGLELVEDRYLVAYIADVTGHGVPAALLAVRLMHAMASATAERTDGGSLRAPSAILAELNTRFCGDISDGRFLTMILCILDTRDGVMRFARAGHPLPLVVRKGDTVAVGESGGLPIGIMTPEQYPDVEVRLTPGDRVCLCSDGFIEQVGVDGHQQFGESRLREVVVRFSEHGGDRMVTEAVRALTEWGGTAGFIDDASLVVVEWVGA